MNVLAFDTSTEILSVAIETNAGDRHATVDDSSLRHSERLVKTIDEVLERGSVAVSDIDLIAVSLGPGSFTGLRIGLATAKGLAVATGADIVQVDTLSVYGALYSSFDAAVVAVIDAKKRRFYAAGYREGVELFPASDLDPREILDRTAGQGRVVITGPHASVFIERASECLRCRLDPGHRRPIAMAMISAAKERFRTDGPAPDDCVPRYVRRSDAELSIERAKRVEEP